MRSLLFATLILAAQCVRPGVGQAQIGPDDPCPLCNPGGLVMPDPDDLRDIYQSDRPAIELDWAEVRCGSDRVARCEDDLGGTIEIDEGAGCKSQQQLIVDGLGVKTSKLQRSALKGDLVRVTPQRELIAIDPATPGPELVSFAREGQLVSRKAIARDLRRRPRGVAPAAQAPAIGCECTCVVWDMVAPQVTNADKGDVGLVPVADGGGEDVVRLLMSSLGQNHRHAVIFLGNHRIRHNTSYDEVTSDDLVDNTHLNPAILRNGTPGITTETVEEALDSERLGYVGLLLKVHDDVLSRTAAELAADSAVGVEGYYKISDYSGLDGMTKSYSGPSTNAYDTSDLRGTMCSGLVYWAFRDVGFVFTDSFYSQSLREDVAKVLYDELHDDIKAGLGFWQAVGSSFLTGTAKHIANQVTNCFAGLGCNDNNSTWKKSITSARTVSPDNLLPRSFDLSGSGDTFWGYTVVSAGDHIDNSHGATTTPFSVVEPLNVLGTTWSESVLTSW